MGYGTSYRMKEYRCDKAESIAKAFASKLDTIGLCNEVAKQAIDDWRANRGLVDDVSIISVILK
jgi:hypothetical protein